MIKAQVLVLFLNWLHSQWTDSVCFLCACLRLAWRYAQCGSVLASFFVPHFLALYATIICSLFPSVSTLSPSPFLHFLLYDLQVYFTTWFPQCPPISLGRRCPPLEASALCSVSPPLPQPPPKPSSTQPPNQPPRAWPPGPHLSLSPSLSTAAPSQSCIALLLPHFLCPLHHPCTAFRPQQHPHTLTICLRLDQTHSTPPVCPTPPCTTRELSHHSLFPSPPPHLFHLPLFLLLWPLLPPCLLPLCLPPPRLVHLQCTTPLG